MLTQEIQKARAWAPFLGNGRPADACRLMQAAEAERRVLDAAKRARAEVEAQLAEKDPEAMGLDASGRRLLAQNRVMAQELALHIEACHCQFN